MILPHLNKQTIAESSISPPIKDGVVQLKRLGGLRERRFRLP